MEQTADAAKTLLSQPPNDLIDLMQDPQTTDEARAAISEIAPAGSALKQLNGSKGSHQATEGRLQIVNEAQDFTNQLSQYLAKWNLLDKGFAYDVVAVFGSQSTGKSTLLNRLFGTSFDVMDESKRQQTTKGIWMCPSKYSSTLVMDVEGTDGRERGEDQDFERKSALFSLASTEVLIVNMWEHQIGLYQGANMALLKTVFEVNLGLFGGGSDLTKPRSKEKTLILFVIRDHVGATPMANLTATLRSDMDKIWASLSKPQHLAEATLDEYFDLSFAALPHKILMPEKFEESVLELRKRFTERSREDYVFQPAYHKRIPADGVSFYMENIWVLTNKDLDLPTQQELLAQFRCDEIAAVATEAFLASSKATRRPVEAGSVVEGLGALLRDWLEVAMGKFDRDASRYHSSVYQRKRADLLAALHASLSPLYLGQLKNLHKQAIVRFDKDLKEGLGKAGYDFGELVRGSKAEARAFFEAGAKEMIVEGTGWEHDNELALLDEDLAFIGDQRRSDETKKMVNAIERSVRKQVLEPVEVALAKPSSKMWDEVLEKYQEARKSGEKSYLQKAKSFGCTNEENERALETLSTRSWLSLRRKLEEQTSDANLLSTLRSVFEDRFRYDESGVPRVWRPEDDLEGLFMKAKDETLALLPIFSHIAPSSPSLLPALPSASSLDVDALTEEDLIAFDSSTAFTLLSPTKLLTLEQRFKREADAAFVEAKRSMVSSVASVPLWMYGALAILGWNEAMAILFNPIYFALLVVGLASAYIILQLGLAGPAIQLAMTVLREGKKIAADKIREAVRETDAAPAPSHRSERRLADPVPASSHGNRSISDEGRDKGDLMAEMLRDK